MSFEFPVSSFDRQPLPTDNGQSSNHSGRLTNLLMKVKRQARELEASESPPESCYVDENTAS
ncbi:MAG: hypothetical protein LAO04_18985 [Acidobacteriia bacterium]|nr:hypothetical protein [Terriglobia bacterium]